MELLQQQLVCSSVMEHGVVANDDSNNADESDIGGVDEDSNRRPTQRS